MSHAAGGMTEVPDGYLAIPAPVAADPSQCRFCRWWRPHGTADRADMKLGIWECRRRSPAAAERMSRGIWPETYGTDWCGDFERFRNPDGTTNRDSHE